MKSPLLLMLAFAFSAPALASEAKPAPKADAAKGQAIATQVCGACHTADGSRGLPANPILQGQHPEYLVKQLHDFKSGERNNAIMKGFASTLSDQDMSDVAAFYASQEGQARFCHQQGNRAAGRADLPRRHRRPQDRRLRRLPQPQRCRHPGAVPARQRPAWRILRSAAESPSAPGCAPTACRWPASPPS